MGGPPWQQRQAYLDNSASFFVERIQTPVLFLGGDSGVPIYHNAFMYQALGTRGVEAQMVIYAGEGHMNRKTANHRDVLERAAGWVEEKLR